MNKVWHKQHPMPKNPTVEERVKWHAAHIKKCGCRPTPPKLLSLMEKKELGRA